MAAEGDPVVKNVPSVVAGSKSVTSWYRLSPEQFADLPEAKQAIRFATLDPSLLAAAIFHATNRQRAKSQLAVLEYDAAASEAARLQASAMATHKFIGHENDFDTTLKTPMDRIRKVGLRPGYIAENVALELARKHHSGETYYTRTVDGVTVFSVLPDGPPIPMHSYIGFAEALLDGWMHSPGHRANILSDKARRLGCAGAPTYDPAGFEMFYCAQVFFAPPVNSQSTPLETSPGQ